MLIGVQRILKIIYYNIMRYTINYISKFKLDPTDSLTNPTTQRLLAFQNRDGNVE